MRKGFWRIAAAFCAVLAAVTAVSVATPSIAVASETKGGEVLVSVSQDSVLKYCSVAVGQRLNGSVRFSLPGAPSQEIAQAAQNPENYTLTISSDDAENISLSNIYGQWEYTLSPVSVGDGKLRITAEFNYEGYKAEGYLKISLAKSQNKIKEIKYANNSDKAKPVSSLTLLYIEKCPVCGKQHYGSEKGKVLLAFERPDEEPTAFDIYGNSSYDDGSGLYTQLSSDQITECSNSADYQLQAPVYINPHSSSAGELRIGVSDYAQDIYQKKRLCDVVMKEQGPAFVEKNMSGKMAIGSNAWIDSSDLIDVELNSTGQACRDSSRDYQSQTWKLSYSVIKGQDIVSIEGDRVTAIKVGTATIEATDSFGGKHVGTIDVIPYPSVKPSIAFLKESEISIESELAPDRTGTDDYLLDANRYRDYFGTVLTKEAVELLDKYPYSEYRFVSSDPSIVSIEMYAVSSSTAGYFAHPNGYGTAKIDVYLGDPDNGGLLCDTMTVHVVKPGEEPAKTTVSIADGYSTSMDKGTTQQLKAKVSPDDKASKVVWSSSNESVLTVDGNGLVTAVGDGDATITATVDGVSATTDTITVTTPVVKVSGVSLSASNLKLAVGGEPSTLTATVEPNNATNKNVSWSSSDPEVVTVADGVVAPVKAGAATITVTTEDGEYSATCKVTVIQPATGITLDKQKVALAGAATEQLKAAVVPAEANQTVVWKSSNESVATVDQTGKVTAVSKGAATITVSTEDGVYSQDCAVTVSNPATNLTVDQTALNLKKGEEGTVKISLVGALAGEVDETKLALDDTGASKAFKVVDNGDGSYTVTALKTGSGSFVITAESLSQTVSVTVTNPVQKVELDKTSLSFTVGDASAKLSATVSPADADDTTVSWTSSDSSIATVKDGVVTPLKAGTATITVTCGDKTMTCTVTVAARTIAGVAGSDGTDVSVSAENNAAAGIAQNNSISLVVEEPTNLTDAANATISGLEQGATKVAEKLDIKLLKNGEVIEDFDGMSFIVRVKMTAAMKALTNLKVLYVAEDGSTQAMDTWTEGDYLCFRTSHFSTYVVAGEEANGEPVQPTQPVTPSQPSQQTTTKVTKKSVKATKGALANTGDQALAVAFIATVAGVALIAFALMRKRFER